MRRTWLLLAGAWIVTAAPLARAQDLPVVSGDPPGQVLGTIRDESGRGIGGAMIVALGPTLVSTRTDPAGRFLLPLPPGEYVIRASRNGFISTYREVVRVPLLRSVLERNIRLARRGAAIPPAAHTGTDGDAAAAAHSHDEAAWRLRRLPATVLRNRGVSAGDWPAETDPAMRAPRVTFLDWARQESRRAAGYFAGVDFSGHVNYFAAGALRRASEGAPEPAPTRVAELAIGAPVGSRGDWTVRGVVDAGRRSVWALHGEYRSRDGHTHTLAVGGFYTAHASAITSASDALPQAVGRRVSGGYLLDRWQAHPAVTVDYGLRVDRYDYLGPHLLPGTRVGVRAALPLRLAFVGSGARSMFAPGSDEFLLPTSAGPWLPPLRTFSTLGQAGFTIEQVGRLEAGLERTFGDEGSAGALSVRWFRESTWNQPALLFGLDEADAGHYFIATPGSFNLEGWSVGFDGPLLPMVTGRVEYTAGQVQWRGGAGAAALTPVVPSVVRTGAERLQDFNASIEAALPQIGTAVLVTYRVSSSFSDASDATPVTGGRFALQVNHALACQPIDGGRLELLFALRTLYRDLAQPGSTYDELLTVSPPLRILGGMRIRF